MPRGIPKKTQADGKGVSKMEGVRRALAALGNDAMPADIRRYLKQEFGIAMETTLISNYKSSLKSSGKSGLMRQTPGRPAKVATGGISLDEIRAVKELADRIG